MGNTLKKCLVEKNNKGGLESMDTTIENRMSFEEFLKYEEANPDKKLEYINGCIRLMSPQCPNHNAVCTSISNMLNGVIEKKGGKCRALTSGLGIIYDKGNKLHKYEGDVNLICDHNYKGKLYNGTPSMIVEVLSKGTEETDKGEKYRTYAENNVPIYWIVDRQERRVLVYTEPIDNYYRLCRVYNDKESIEFNGEQLAVIEFFDNFLTRGLPTFEY